MTNIILDAPFDSDNLDKISQYETIIWRGAPSSSSSSSSLSIFDLGLDFSFIIALVKRGAFFSWFILAFILYSIYLELNPISLTIWATIAITSIVAPEYLLIKRKMNTRYILTSKQLIFHL